MTGLRGSLSSNLALPERESMAAGPLVETMLSVVCSVPPLVVSSARLLPSANVPPLEICRAAKLLSRKLGKKYGFFRIFRKKVLVPHVGYFYSNGC